MAKNLIQDGNTIDVVAKTNIKSGDVVVVESLIAIALTDAEIGESTTGSVTGVWQVAAKADDVIKQGAKIYWNKTNKEATITETSNTYLGIAWTDSPGASESVAVKING